MKAVGPTLVAIAVLALMLCGGLGAGAAPVKAIPSIEGNYVIDYRELPDGRKIHAPEIVGMMTFSKDHRNFNLYWTDDGRPCSLSTISTYTLSDKEYTEVNLYRADNAAGKGVTYDVAPAQGKSPVTAKAGGFEFILPLHSEPVVAFDKSGFTATRKGAFVDHWKKMN